MKTIILQHLSRNFKLYIKYLLLAILSAVLGYFLYRLYSESQKIDIFESYRLSIQKFVSAKTHYESTNVFLESFRETFIRVLIIWLSSFLGIGHILTAFFIIKDTSCAGFGISLCSANYASNCFSSVIILFVLPAIIKLILFCFTGVCSYRFKTLCSISGNRNINLIFVFTLYFIVPLILGIILAFYESYFIPQYLFNTLSETFI